MANFIPKIVYDAGAGDVTVQFALKPMGDPIHENLKSNHVTTRTGDGQYQRNQNFIDEVLGSIKHTFVEKAVIDAYRTFFEDWGSKKEQFKYYIHSDEVTYETYTLVDANFNPVRSLPGAANDFLYDMDYILERVI